MEPVPNPSGPDVERLRVSEDLVKQLRDADERCHAARNQVENTMDDAGFSHGQRVEEKTDQLRKAEREVQEIQQKIKEIMKREP